MTNSLENFKKNILSFIGLGIFVVLFLASLFIFSYIIIIGAVIGLVLFAVAYVRARILQSRAKQDYENKHGRVIDYQDVDKD